MARLTFRLWRRFCRAFDLVAWAVMAPEGQPMPEAKAE